MSEKAGGRRKPVYADLGDLEEDKRIAVIAGQVRAGKVVSFTDDNAKADRHIAKLQQSIGVTLLDRGSEALGVKNTVWVKVGPITL